MGRKRNLQAHNNLLVKVIKDQAGTLEKAILEAVMNAVEAGSPYVHINLETNEVGVGEAGAKLVITDGGKGFRNEEEILEWFEKFGTPHKESEGKKWAKFRMGRGQGFAFGKNTWTTGEFRMVVDINKWGLEYELDSGLEHYDGCKIEIDLYSNPIGSYNYPTVEKLAAEIKKQIEFMPGEITFNGEQLNTPPEDCEWTLEDDMAYYLFTTGVNNFTYYNSGAFVCTVPASVAGVTGIAVSKPLLDVNFARNEIKSACPVYNHIQTVLHSNRIKKTRKTRCLDEHERHRLITDARDGTVKFPDIRGIQIIDLTNGKRMSPLQVSKVRIPWTFAPRGDAVADALLVADRAVCFDSDIIRRTGYTGDEANFFDWLFAKYDNDHRRGGLKDNLRQMKRCYKVFKAVDKGDDLSSGISRANIRLPEEKWTKTEKIIVKALTRCGQYCGLKNWDNRTICIGTSQTAWAWTDGNSYICLARTYLKQLKLSGNYPDGIGHLVGTMLHEMAHEDSTEESHGSHGFSFYETFYRLCCESGGVHRSPLNLARYLQGMLRECTQEQHQKECEEKEAKAKAKRDKALGLTNPVKKPKKTTMKKVKGLAAAKKKVKKKRRW